MRWCCLTSCPAWCHLHGCWPRSQKAGESPCLSQFSPAFPRGVPPARLISTALVLSWWAACGKLHPLLKDLNQSSKHHPVGIAERSNSFLTQQHSGMGTPPTAVLKLVHAAQFSQFFHCVMQRHVVFPSAQVNFSLSFFFNLISRSPDP